MGGGGEEEIIYLSQHCHHQNDSCIKMGRDESHFNVSVGSNGQSHKTVSTNHASFLLFLTFFIWVQAASFGIQGAPSCVGAEGGVMVVHQLCGWRGWGL